MNLLLNTGIAIGVLILVWLFATIRWAESRQLAGITPGTGEIELSANPDPHERQEAVKLHHVAENFPIERLIQFTLLLCPTIIAWYFADKIQRPYDSEWYGMYAITAGIYGISALVMIVMDLRKLQTYRSDRTFLLGAQAVLQQQLMLRRRAGPVPPQSERARPEARPEPRPEPRPAPSASDLFSVPHEASVFTNGNRHN